MSETLGVKPQCHRRLTVVYGPPGTGKTTHLMRDMTGRLANGVCLPEQIGFVSFTTSAVDEAIRRASDIVGGAELPYFKTLHAFGFTLLGRPPMVGPPDEKLMFATWGYKVNLDPDAKAANGSDTARIRRWELLRDSSRSMQEAYARLQGERGDFRVLVERYERLKRDEGRIDFPDQLMLGMDREIPRLAVLYVDEAQDLNPLQIEFAERLMRQADEVIIAGDDDQAVMRFQGATPEWLQGFSRTATVHYLPQSHRVPASVHEMAEHIVRRIKQRVQKDYKPREEMGEVTSSDSVEDVLSRAADALRDGRTAAYLARTNVECSDAVEWALAGRVPFRAHAGHGSRPLQSEKLLESCLAAVHIRTGAGCSRGELIALLDEVDSPPRGAKADAKRLAEDEVITATQAATTRFGDVWSAIRSSEGRFEALTKIPDQVRAYLDAVLLEDGSAPSVVLDIGTMHWSKGQEWDLVILDDMLPRPSVDALREGGIEADDEHRCAYVAVTRARQTLIVLSKEHRAKHAGTYAGRYPYPVAPAVAAEAA